MFGDFGLLGGGGIVVAAEAVGVIANATGVVAQLRRSLPGSSFTNISGAPTISLAGAISIAAGLAVGASTVIVVREALGLLALEYPVTLIGVGVIVVVADNNQDMPLFIGDAD